MGNGSISLETRWSDARRRASTGDEVERGEVEVCTLRRPDLADAAIRPSANGSERCILLEQDFLEGDANSGGLHPCAFFGPIWNDPDSLRRFTSID